MSLYQNMQTLTRLQALLQQAYELADYTRSKFDSAPLPIGYYPGHVEHDRQFCRQNEQLKAEIKSMLEQAGDPFEYQRFVARLERRSPTIQQGHYPNWNRSARCRCWWDAKGELLEVADYLEEFISKTESQQMANSQTGMGSVQKRVIIHRLGKARMDYVTDNIEYIFGVSAVDSRFVGQPRERSETDFHKIKVGMTWELRVNWRLDDDNAEMNVVKVLAEHCREHVVEKLQQELPLENELLLTPQNSPNYFVPTTFLALLTQPTLFLLSSTLRVKVLPGKDRESSFLLRTLTPLAKRETSSRKR